jgi:hypothetical protein
MAAAGTTKENRRSGHDLLGIYLNDHLAGATGGVELARRMAGTSRSQPPEATLRQAAGWRTLRVAADDDSRPDAGRLDELISRAQRQEDLLEELRVQAAERVVGTGGAVRAS